MRAPHPDPQRGTAWVLIAFVLWFVSGCHEDATDSTLPLAPCRIDGFPSEVLCGRHEVPEDRKNRASRTLSLSVAVIPALADAAQPDPLFVLAGGPGQAASEVGGQLSAVLEKVRQQRDIVLVDQRGTGSSHPLDCPKSTPTLAERFAPRSEPEQVRACRQALDAEPAHYTTPVAMDDLDEVREALGYERINLWGGSYGSRAALVYAQRHPEHTRSLVLDGVALPSLRMPLTFARDAQRALDLLYTDCQRDTACRAAFLDGKAHFEQLLAALEGEPRAVEVEDPNTGKPTRIVVTRTGLASVVLQVLYVPELASLLPYSIEQARRGDFGPFAAQAAAFTDAVQLSEGMFLSILCTEDVPRVTEADVVEWTRGTFLGEAWFRLIEADCRIWDVPPLPLDDEDTIASSNTPLLALSGHLDPVLPPRWGEQVTRFFPRSRHVVVPGGGHGVTRLGCVPDLIAAFLRDLDPAALSIDCTERIGRPPFFVRATGPEP